jgi:DNA-binding LacI/PurR family transcriptional regulator
MPSTLSDTLPLSLPPKMTLDALAARTGVSADTLRGYFYRGRAVPPQTRRLVAAALRRYAMEVEAVAARLEKA